MEKQSSYIFNFSIFLLKIAILVSVIGFALSFTFEKLIIFKNPINGASKVNKILSKNIEDEIPIFGSSRALGNFVPSIISNKQCFNYGMSGAQANIWLFFLEEELKKDKHTPIIVNFDLVGFVYADGNIGNYIPNWDSTKDILSNKGEFYYNIPFIKYYGQYERYLKFYINEKANFTKVTDHGGSFEKNQLSISKFSELVKRRENTAASFDLNDELSKKFSKLIESTDREIILVVSPYHISYFNKFRNIDEADNYLGKLQDLDNISLIDLRSYITEDSMFLNTSHLNYKGAVKFSKRLKELLVLEPIGIN